MVATLSVNISSNYRFDGQLLGLLSLTKLGSGTLSLGAVNVTGDPGASTNFNGTVTIQAGTLKLLTSTAWSNGNFGNNPGVILSGSGVLDLNGMSIAMDSLNSSSASASVMSSTGPATLTVNGGGTFAGALVDGVGPLSLTKTDSSSTLILSGANTYSGATLISAGTLQIGNAGSTGSLGTGNVTNNGRLVFNKNVNTTDRKSTRLNSSH